MNKLRRFYNQNRKTIWGVIIIITFAFALLQLANYIARTNNEKEMQKIIAQKEQQNKAKTENQTKNTEQTNTVVANSNTQSSSTNKNIKTDTIKQFITYCNKKELENAYNMLTDDCKKEMYNDIETFERLYYNGNFENTIKETEITNWSNNTYLVYFKESALSTGKIKDENQKGDYITVVGEKENGYKLNINSYIGYKKINKTKTKENVKIEVIGKNIYLDYEKYDIKVTNEGDTRVILDTLDNIRSIYLEDINGIKYPSYSNELIGENLVVDKKQTKNISIKFYNSYISDRKITSLTFSSMRIDNKSAKYIIEF